MEKGTLNLAAGTMTVFGQLRQLACSIDKRLKDARAALSNEVKQADERLGRAPSGGGAPPTSSIALLRRKLEEANTLMDDMAEFLKQLNESNDKIESSVSASEALLRGQIAAMDGIEEHLRKYGYAPYDPSSQCSQSGTQQTPCRLDADEEDKENGIPEGYEITCAVPSSVSKTPARALLGTPKAQSRAKENILLTPRLTDFVSKDTLSFIVGKKASHLAPRSLPFNEMSKGDSFTSSTSVEAHLNFRSRHPPMTAVSTESAVSVTKGTLMNVDSRLITPSKAWREPLTQSPDMGDGFYPLKTPECPPCLRHLTGMADHRETERKKEPDCDQQLAFVSERIPRMLENEYGSLDSFLQRTLSRDDINKAVDVLGQLFSTVTYCSRDTATAALVEHLGRKSKSLLYLLIKTGRLQSEGCNVQPIPLPSQPASCPLYASRN